MDERVLGVHGTSDTLWLAFATDGELVDLDQFCIKPAKALQGGDTLLAVVEEAERLITRGGVTSIFVLTPESTYTSTYGSFAPRLTMETLLAVAAAHQEIPFAQISRKKIRSIFGLPAKGGLDTHVSAVVPVKQAPHWGPGKRDLATLTALAGCKVA